jgi:hypothetical protein
MAQDAEEEPFKYSNTLTADVPSRRSAYSTHSVLGTNKNDWENLCSQILELQDIATCTIVGYHGVVLAEDLGDVEADPEIRANKGSLAAVIWGGLTKVEKVGGPISFASVIYEKFKVVGVPFPEARVAVVVTSDVSVDSYHLKDMIFDYVQYFRGRTGS